MTDSGNGRFPGQAVIPRRWLLPLALALVAALTVAAYWPVLRNGFISYDDNDYVTVNMMVRQGLTLKGLFWSLGAFHAANWHPLTWLSHMLDIELFDLNPMGHHATSLALHVANALLLCALLHRLTGYLGRSLVVALLFAVHPLHVESVAWVSERKDVLSTFFWLLTMAAYVRYARSPSLRRYLPVAILLALGLMAKQMLVTLPLVLLLLDVWPLKRCAGAPADGTARVGWKGLLLEKVPLFALCGAAALVVLFAQKSAGAVRQGDAAPFLINAGNALISYARYLGEMCYPVRLALFYPFDPAYVSAPRVAAAVALLAAISYLAVQQRNKRPYLAFGWLWYLITLLPVIGFLRIGSQALADRYTYVPLIGIFLALTWGVAELAGNWRRGPLAAGVLCAALIGVLCVMTATQVRYWKSSAELYDHALEAVPGNWMAHNNLGILQFQQNRYSEALAHFQESVRCNPGAAEGFRNLGNAYQATGNGAAALDAFREAVRLNPLDAEAHFHLGYAYLMGGNSELAYQEYLQLQPLDTVRANALLDSIRMTTGR